MLFLKSKLAWIVGGILAAMAFVATIYLRGMSAGKNAIRKRNQEEVARRRDAADAKEKELRDESYDDIIDKHL